MKLLLVALVLGSAPLTAPLAAQAKPTVQELIAGQPYCADSVEDQAAPGNCIPAASVPTIGMLYPLSADFFVDPGTGALHVNGQVVGGVSTDASGSNSTVSGGSENSATWYLATISGGQGNTALGPFAAVGGGRFNTAWGASAVAGGEYNEASGLFAAVGGGSGNTARGRFSVAPGGELNTAQGDYSFAAGQLAEALHHNTFVWSGDPDLPMVSTGTSQFLISAPGGVGIGTNAPMAALEVAGDIRGTLVAAANPNDPGVSASLSWLNDVARIRIGGSGAGAQSGLDIQTVGNASLMRITGAGNVGIGTTSPGVRLDVNGTVRCTGLINLSDARLKTNVRELEGALEKVRALRGVSFDWDRDALPKADAGRQLGFLAQEVGEVLPDVVHADDEGRLAVNYTQLIPVLVEALQEQERSFRSELDALQRQIDELTAKNR